MMRSSSRVLSSLSTALSVLAAVGFSGLAMTAQAQSYTLTDLGTLGGSQSFATDVNNSGQVVGNSLTGDGSTHGFLYNVGGSLKDLGTTVNSSNYFGSYTNVGMDSYANSINNKGQIAGYIYGTSFGSVGFVSTPNGGTLNGLYINNDSATVVVGINDKGQVAGEAGSEGFFYDPNGGASSTIQFQFLGPIAINNQGQVLGEIPFASEAALTGPNGGPGGNAVSNLGAIHFSTFDVNDNGQVVGSSQDMSLNGVERAFLTGPNGMTATDLGSLDTTPIGYGAVSEAHGVNNKNQVVGTSGTASSYNPDRAFFWENGMMTDLNSLIAPGSGFTLTDATAISDTGYIVGNGTDAEGLTHAFLLTPAAVPEVSSVVSLGLLLLLGGIGLAMRRRRAA